MVSELTLNIGVVILAISAVTLLWYKGDKKGSLKMIATFVQAAEEKFGSGQGKYKYDYVISNVYPILPSIIRTFVSPNVLDAWIEAEVNNLQEKLNKEIKK